MQNYLRCGHCGYDLYGPEYLANVIDASSFSTGAFYPENALLEMSTKSSDAIVCPNCHESGYWHR